MIIWNMIAATEPSIHNHLTNTSRKILKSGTTEDSNENKDNDMPRLNENETTAKRDEWGWHAQSNE